MQQTEGDGGSKARSKQTRRRRQLYLLLDDWAFGCSIRKIDDPAYACWHTGLQPLPPMYQLEAPARFATSLGAHIMLAHLVCNEAQAFHPRSRSLINGPRPHGFPSRGPTFIPFGNHRLCALWGGSLQLCECEEGFASSSMPCELPVPGPYWSWRKVRDLPFDEGHVTSYAVHPDGQTILVSVAKTAYPWGTIESEATYFFNVDDWSSDALEQDWCLPFRGRCYFVGELNAWVGLSRFGDSIGHLCACPSVTADSTRPSCKISKEGLFSKDLKSCLSATLVHMGNREFCLVECIMVGESSICKRKPLIHGPFDFLFEKEKVFHPLLKLTRFFIMFDDNGDLTTGNTSRSQYYGMPGSVSGSSVQCPVVFLM